MKQERVVAVRRVLAFSLDWLLMVLWGGALFGAVMIIAGGNPPLPDGPWQAQGIGFVTMTVPVMLYSAVLRNAIKFAPWEFGHTVAQQAAFSGEGSLPTWVWVPAAIAFIGPIFWVAGIVVTGRAPYDYFARTRVGRSTDLLRNSETTERAAQQQRR